MKRNLTRTLSFVFLAFLYSSILCAQKSYYHTLQDKSTSDSLKMEAAYTISFEICHTLPDSGIYYANLSLSYAQKINKNKGKASAYSQIGYSFALKGEVDSSLLYWNKSIDIYKKNKDPYSAAKILNNVGSNLIFKGEYDKAKTILDEVERTFSSMDSLKQNIPTYNNLGLLYDVQGDYISGQKYYMKAVKLSQALNDTLGIANAYNNIAVMYFYLDNYEKSIQYSYESLKYTVNNKYTGLRGKTFKNMALSYEYLNNIDSALHYHYQSLEIDKSMNNQLGIAKSYHNMGGLYYEKGNYSKALDYLLKAKNIKETYADQEGISSTYNYLGKIYTKKKDFKTAYTYLTKGLEIATDLQIPEELLDIYLSSAEYYHESGDDKQSYKFLNLHRILNDSIKNVDVKNKLADLELKYETAKKEAENENLKAEQVIKSITISRQKRTIIAGVLGLLLLSFFLALLYRKNKIQKQLTLQTIDQKNKIQTLHSELKHRFSNNLAFIQSLLEMEVRRTKHFETRQLLQDSENRLHTLSLVQSNLMELDSSTQVNLKEYLTDLTLHLESIYTTRDRKLDIQTNFADCQFGADDAMRIGLVTNELITNSVKHAFHDSNNAIINIKTQLNPSNKLILSYNDNGPGLKIESDASIQKESSSLGLKLIQILKNQIKNNFELIVFNDSMNN